MSAVDAIRVRRAEVRDAEALMTVFSSPAAMAGTLQTPYPSVDMWKRRIGDNAPDDYLLVAEVGTEIVGNLGLHLASRSPRRRHAAGIGMAVRDDWQRRGVGSALLAAGIDLADRWLNYRRLELTVYADNAVALALYRKFGFAVEGTLRDYAFRDGRFVDALTMARLHPASVPATNSNGAHAPGMASRKATGTVRKPRAR